MELLTVLTLAHLLADFPLQTNSIAARKATSILALLSHVLIHMLMTWALFGFKWRCYPIVFGLGISHFAIDWLKPRAIHTTPMYAFLIDQSAHILCIFLAAGVAIYSDAMPLASIFPASVIYPSLLLGFVFATMVFLGLCTTTLEHNRVAILHRLRFSQNRLLEVEQRAGFCLIIFMLICLVFNN